MSLGLWHSSRCMFYVFFVTITVAVALLSVILICAVLICVKSIVKSASPGSFGEMMLHFRIVVLMLMCKIPNVTLIPTEPVYVIPVYFNAWVYSGTDNLWACIVAQLFKRTEEVFGYWKTRIYRQTDWELSRPPNPDAGSTGNALHLGEEREGEKRNGSPDHAADANSLTIPVKCAKWREKIPYCIVAFLVLTAITTSVSLLVIVAVSIGSTDVDQVYAYILQAVGGGILGVTLLTQIKKVCIFLQNLCVSQSSRIKILNRLSQRSSETIMESLGFMHKVKSEIKITMGFIKVMEKYYGRRFRILILIEDLDRCKDDKIRDIFEALKLLLSDDGDPIVSIVNIDPAPISRALSEHGKNGRIELEKLVNLRFCMPKVTAEDIATAFKNKTQEQAHNLWTITGRTEFHPTHSLCNENVAGNKQTSTSKLQTQSSISPCLDIPIDVSIECCLTTTELSVSRTADCDDFWSKSFKKDEEGVFVVNHFRLIMTLLATKEVEKNTDLLENSYKALPYLYFTIKMSVACWTAQLKKLKLKDRLKPTQEDSARILRQRAYITCTELAQWLLITYRWPYRASWLLYSIEEPKSLGEVADTESTMFGHYSLIKHRLHELPAWKSYIQLDGGEREFVSALDRFNTLKPQLVINLMPYTVNLDRGIKRAITYFLDLSEQQQSEHHVVSSQLQRSKNKNKLVPIQC